MRTTIERLIESLQSPAADSATQVALFPDFVNVADELALTCHECLLAVEPLADTGLVSADQMRRLRALDALIEDLGRDGDERHWTPQALAHGEEWRRIRELAEQALASFGRGKRPPNLDWISYVEGCRDDGATS